ncbi:MAG: hypothetical protein QS721_02715 [Candidatus Endonucleobacter sp. (ex Gigantidas childressi)]|nr:hypothetical protein [Candidatus Endonucleobacter sp. (ex Gigantidas childressi)]
MIIATQAFCALNSLIIEHYINEENVRIIPPCDKNPCNTLICRTFNKEYSSNLQEMLENFCLFAHILPVGDIEAPRIIVPDILRSKDLLPASYT